MIFIIPIIILKLLIRMTLTSLTLLNPIASMAASVYNGARGLPSQLIWECSQWAMFLLALAPRLLLSVSTTMVFDAILVLCYAWGLFWHPKGRSLLQILKDPGGSG